MRIEVTQRHIDLGHIANHQNCPIALALKEHLMRRGTYHSVDVGISRAVVNGVVDYHIPTEVRHWTHNFDRDLSVSPITFDLERIIYLHTEKNEIDYLNFKYWNKFHAR